MGGAPTLPVPAPPVPPAPAPLVAAAPRPAAAPARMLVFASEYRLNLSRTRLRAGRAIIQMRNIGQDDHDLAIRRPDGTPVAAMPVVHPGDTGEIRTRLRAGRYVMFCRVVGHEGMGMRASFTVTRPGTR